MSQTLPKEIEIAALGSGKFILPSGDELEGLDAGELVRALEYTTVLMKRDYSTVRKRWWRFLSDLFTRQGTVRLVLYQVRQDIFPGQPIVYPALLSRSSQLEMSVSELITEIELILSMADTADLYSGTHLYSIQVVEPLNLAERSTVRFLDALVPAEQLQEVKHGYFHHAWLYQTYETQPTTLFSVLPAVLEYARTLEISVRPRRGVPTERKTIKIIQPRALSSSFSTSSGAFLR